MFGARMALSLGAIDKVTQRISCMIKLVVNKDRPLKRLDTILILAGEKKPLGKSLIVELNWDTI